MRFFLWFLLKKIHFPPIKVIIILYAYIKRNTHFVKLKKEISLEAKLKRKQMNLISVLYFLS